MISEYREDDGMDPGLGEMSYDGAEYEMDEFGERIGSEDDFEADLAAEDELESADDGTSMQNATGGDAAKVEQGFGETLKPEQNPHIEEQIKDPELHEEAKSDFDSAEGMDNPAEEDRPVL